MGTRRKGRIIAFQTLYQYDLTNQPLEELLEFLWMDEGKHVDSRDEALLFARLLVTGVTENLTEVDSTIRKQLENWDFTRLARVDLAILRMSVYCLLRQPEIPATVTIDEAIDIARQFGSDDSYRFVNGVLDGIRKQWCQ